MNYCTNCGKELGTSGICLCRNSFADNTGVYYNLNKIYAGTLFGISIYVNTQTEYALLCQKLREYFIPAGWEELNK